MSGSAGHRVFHPNGMMRAVGRSPTIDWPSATRLLAPLIKPLPSFEGSRPAERLMEVW
jgi:hypothetical protein